MLNDFVVCRDFDLDPFNSCRRSFSLLSSYSVILIDVIRCKALDFSHHDSATELSLDLSLTSVIFNYVILRQYSVLYHRNN